MVSVTDKPCLTPRPELHSGGEQDDVVAEVAAFGLVEASRTFDDPKERDLLVVERVGRSAIVIDEDLKAHEARVSQHQLAIAVVPTLSLIHI